MTTSENEPLLEATSPAWSPPRGFFWIQLGVYIPILAYATDRKNERLMCYSYNVQCISVRI